MRADLFYQSHANKVLPLILVTKLQCDEGLPYLTDEGRNFLLSQQFKGKTGDVCLMTDNNGWPVTAYIGTGDGNESLAMAHAATKLPSGCYEPQQKLSQQSLLMWSLAQYRFNQYKKQDVFPRELLLDKNTLKAVVTDANAIFLVRDLINQPANALGPKELAREAASLANQYDAKFEEWVDEELLAANFPAIHAVGRASSNAPRLICLTWGNSAHPRVTVVGKGVCFDSGGLDIKPSSGMRLMKKDMGGAAHALGLAQWIMANKLAIHLQVLIPAVENSIGPNAFRPGDILTMRNGLNVEIDNTDAEGRLVLADALVKAGETTPELIINFATLTGAARVAVGTEIAAMFTNDEALSSALIASSEEVGDPVWRLPLFAGYETMLDSSVADIANASTSAYAGAITAALFLKRFIPAKTSWVHFDIMAWNVAGKPGKPEGGEAMGIRAVAHYLQSHYAGHD